MVFVWNLEEVKYEIGFSSLCMNINELCIDLNLIELFFQLDYNCTNWNVLHLSNFVISIDRI